MQALRLILRIYSYLVNTGAAAAALAMSALILMTPNHTIRIGWLPWTGEELGSRLAALGVAGIAVVLLALAGRLRWLLVLFSLVVLVLVAKGLFWSRWQFSNMQDFKQAIWITVGLLVSVIGAIPAKRNR